MLAIPLAIAWSVWARHRRDLLVTAGMLLAAVATSRLPGVSKLPRDWLTVALLIVPAAMMAYLFSVLMLHEGRPGRDHGFPSRLFTLPVSTPALVAWPMLLGATAVAAAWGVVSLAIVRPRELPLPEWPVGPALATAAVFFQAMAWTALPTPFRGPWGRALAVVFLGGGLVLLALYADVAGGPGHTGLRLVLPFYMLGAYALGVVGVSRDRRGDARPQAAGLARLEGAGTWLTPRAWLGSPSGAALWLEWRGKGLLLPLFLGLYGLPLVAATLLGALGPAVARAALPPPLLGAMVLGVVALAPIFGTALAKRSFTRRDWRLPAFEAARPVSDAALAAAKLKMTARSTAAAWIVPLVLAVPLALAVQGSALAEAWRGLAADLGPPAAAGVAAWIAVALVLLTWRGIAGGLVVGLTGRAWLVSVVGYVAVGSVGSAVTLGLGIAWWVFRLGDFTELGGIASSVAVAAFIELLVLKAVLAGWTLRRAVGAGHLSPRAAAGLVAAWLAVGLTMAGWLAALAPWARAHALPLVLAALLLTPLTRIAAAPLAVAWNRHR